MDRSARQGVQRKDRPLPSSAGPIGRLEGWCGARGSCRAVRRVFKGTAQGRGRRPPRAGPFAEPRGTPRSTAGTEGTAGRQGGWQTAKTATRETARGTAGPARQLRAGPRGAAERTAAKRATRRDRVGYRRTIEAVAAANTAVRWDRAMYRVAGKAGDVEDGRVRYRVGYQREPCPRSTRGCPGSSPGIADPASIDLPFRIKAPLGSTML